MSHVQPAPAAPEPAPTLWRRLVDGLPGGGATGTQELTPGAVVALPWLLGGLTVVAAVQTVLAGAGGGGTALTLAVAADLLATLALVASAVLGVVHRLPPWAAAAALVLATLAASIDAAATGSPVAAASVVLVLVGAGLLTPGWLVVPVGGCALLGWTAALVTAGALDRAGQPARAGSALGTFSPSAWTAATAMIAAGVAAALGVRRLVATEGAQLAEVRDAALSAAVRDPLTGAANRKGLDLLATPMLENARRQGQAVHCLLLDVDGFATVNEAAGRSGGDEVLICVAEALEASVRGTDVVARWAGDQFVVLGPGTGSSPLELERRIKAQLALAPVVPEAVWPGQVSIGSATLVPWDDGDLESLLSRADADMNLRRSLRRQGTERRGGSISRPPTRPMPGLTDH